MRLPFALHPWNSSPESVKKLFKVCTWCFLFKLPFFLGTDLVLTYVEQVVHFLYTYSVTLDICPFTIDEFTRAFHDKVANLSYLMITISNVAEGNCFPFTLSLKVTYILHFLYQDSLLLGKIHLSLLKLLLLDVETELQRGSFSTLSISCKFLALLQSVCGAIYFFPWHTSV